MEAFRHRRRSGAALMLSLWALFLLSAMVIAWALDIDARLTLSGNANRILEAEALACSGAEVAMHPAMTPGAKALEGGFGKDQRYKARILGEGGRLNLKWLLIGEKPGQIEVLRKYLENKGVDLNERDRMIDTLLDWIDPDNLVRLDGAENGPGYKPANKMLTSVDELKEVRGWEEFTSARDWDADFTLNSTGAPDIAWASRDVLLALPGLTETMVDQFLALRRGPDGEDGTEDDAVFTSQQDALLALGLSGPQLIQILSMTSFKDPVLRVVSVGKSGSVTRTVQLVFLKQGNSIQLKSWKEF